MHIGTSPHYDLVLTFPGSFYSRNNKKKETGKRKGYRATAMGGEQRREFVVVFFFIETKQKQKLARNVDFNQKKWCRNGNNQTNI